MEFVTQQQGDVCIVSLQGQRLDAYHAANLKTELTKLMQTGQQRFILDFSEVKFLDSGGLGVLMDLHKRLRKPAGAVLCNITERTILDVLRLTRMDQVLHIYVNIKSAVNAFS